VETDYLVIGSGAMGMAFSDVLMTETDATIVMVDKRGRPGGHWNDAYPFVRLHQPSAFYGVNSLPLGSDAKDDTGWNQGLYELASGSEVCAYFDHVMQRQFLPSGRFRYFPMCEYRGDRRFTSLVTGADHQVTVRKRVVDATYMNVMVPSMRAPLYEVAPGLPCVPPNDLPRIKAAHAAYVIIGAGKTGMDACLWLLQNDVDPDLITWIMPRDSWLLDRANIQPGELSRKTIAGMAKQLEAIAQAESIEGLFDALNGCGQLLRFDDNVRPTMYRCATVTRTELEQLRRIKNVVRLGRVKRLEADAIVLDEGSIPTTTGHLHVDCSADGLARRPVVPVFDGDRITLQSVRTCQQVFSAAFIGHIEASVEDEAEKNALCTVIPHPDSDLDWLRTTLANTLNQIQWTQNAGVQAWLAQARLDGFSQAISALTPPSAEQQVLLNKIMTNMQPAVDKLRTFVAELDQAR
jgi:hypothetical protein